MKEQLLFYIACQEGHLEIVQALIEAAGENKALLFQATNTEQLLILQHVKWGI